jgi:antitoxin HicB
MEAQNLSKAEMARRMRTSRAALERLLDPENHSVTINSLDKAARSLG